MQQTTLEDSSVEVLIGLDSSIRVEILDISESFAGGLSCIESDMNL